MPTPDNPQPVPALNNTLASKLDPKAKRQQSNSAGMLALLGALRQQETTIREGGGAKAIEAQHAKQRLTARERIALLLDPGTELFELGAYAAFDMYAEWGGAPAAGVICGLGRVSGRLSMIVANDATVKAGAFFPMTAKKVLRAQHIAMENHLPTLYLVDSSGIFLPLQEDVFPDQDDFGRIFRNNARMSAMGIPQITAIMGMCVAGGAYLPVMTDHVLMTEGSGLFLAGPALVEAAIGQKYSAEELGGATMHAEISGTVDFKEPNDHLCIARLRSLVSKLGHPARAPFDRAPYDAAKDAPKYSAEDLYALLDPDPARASTNTYDMHELIARLVDRSEFDEYKPDYGRTVLCGYATHRRLRRRHRRQPEAASAADQPLRRKAHRVRRRHLRRERRQSRALHPRLQPEPHPARSSSTTSTASWSAATPNGPASSAPAPRWSPPSPTPPCPRSPSSSAVPSAPATTPCAAKPTTRASSSPGPPRATPSCPEHPPPARWSKSASAHSSAVATS